MDSSAFMDSSALGIDDYPRLFDELADGLFVANPAGIYLAVNPSGHRLLGYDAGELIGKSLPSSLCEYELPRLQSTLAALAAGRITTEFWAMRRKDGNVIHVELRAQKISDGNLLGVVRETYRDDDQRKTQLSEARLWSILVTAPDIIITADVDGKILFINRTVPPITMEQILGASCFDFVPPESRQRVAQAIQHVFTTGAIDEYEVRRPPDVEGNCGWSSVRVGPMFKDGRVVAVTMCATDVSEYKREVARTQELLQQLHKIASLVPGMVFQFKQRSDGTSCFPYVSEYIHTFFGVSPDSVLDDASEVFANIYPDDLAGVNAALIESAAMRKAIHHKFRVLSGTGKLRWLCSDTAVPEAGMDGSLLWHGFLTDVSERKEAEQLRARLEEQLMQSHKMESIGQLAGGVAHDFNNLLTVVNGFVDLTLDELSVDSHVRNYLEGIKNAAARGATLTQQLVAFARKKIVRPENICLNSILNRMAPMIRRLVGEHIDVQLCLSDEPSVVKVDVGSIEQVLMNLIVNARDAMPDGGTLKFFTQAIQIDHSVHALHPGLQPGDYIVLSVSDTGCGISPEIRSRLFEPFFTTKPKGSGTGLGLAMCHGIVNQAGGVIEVRSEINRGSTFDVYLPDQHGAESTAQVITTPVKTSIGNETILIVEDEPLILQLITSTLEKLGYHVLAANDGIEALQVVSNTATKIDLLVTDVIMPRLGGHDLSSRLQQQMPQLKVLFMSGYAENALAHQGELQPGLNFIQKPYHPAELAQRVREVLDGVCLTKRPITNE